MTNIQGSVQACPPRHARGTHKPLSSAETGAQECESPHSDSRHQCVTVARPDGLRRYALLAAGDVADDLGPKPSFGAAAHSEDASRWLDPLFKDVDYLSDAESDAFVGGSESVPAGVLK